MIFPANCAELVTEVTVTNSLAPATASAEPVDTITSVIALPKTSVPTIVLVLPLSLVPAVVTVTFLAPPPRKVVAAIVAPVFGRAAVTKRSGSAAFSSVIKATCTSDPAILISYNWREGRIPPLINYCKFIQTKEYSVLALAAITSPISVSRLSVAGATPPAVPPERTAMLPTTSVPTLRRACGPEVVNQP